MGHPFPFPDEPGAECARCKHLFPDQITPKYLYAKIDDVVPCPGAPGGLPDINGVHRLEQDPLIPCIWSLIVVTGAGNLKYALDWLIGNSNFGAEISPFFTFFSSFVMVQCLTLFNNQLICGPIFFPVAAGGTCEIFWGP